MSKILIAYFSASGVTARTAKEMAKAAGADLYEICPAEPYTAADLNWMDQKSRSTLEMNDPACRPAIAAPAADLDQYDKMCIRDSDTGFPSLCQIEHGASVHSSHPAGCAGYWERLLKAGVLRPRRFSTPNSARFWSRRPHPCG